MAQVDFYTMLSGLGDTIAAQRKDNLRREALSSINNPDGTVDFQKAILGLTRAGDVEGAARISQLANTAENMKFRREESVRAQANADRSHSLQERQLNATLEGGKVPAGFERNPAGGLRPVAGGPTDPAYLERANEAKTKPRSVSISDITKLSEEGGKFQQVGGFLDTFDPDFAGRPIIGEARNWVGRTLPSSMVDPKAAEGATWWQGYDRFKNVVRNDLFGSALTATEKSAFEKADINPGMNPDSVKANLKIQKEIYQKGIARKAGAMVDAGYDPAVIGKAYGVDLGALGIEGKKGKSATTAAPPAGDALQKARDAIARGAPREAVIKRLVEAGIKPEGL